MAKIEKFSICPHQFVENNKRLKVRALSFNVLTLVGKMGEIITEVLGDSLPIRSTLCMKRLKDL